MFKQSDFKLLALLGIMLATVSLTLYSCALVRQKHPVTTPMTQTLGPPTHPLDLFSIQKINELPEGKPPFSPQNRDPHQLLKDFPRDSEGNLDWVKVLKDGAIHPKGTLEPDRPEIPPFPLDVEIPAVGAMPNVIFPHLPHTLWLECGNCHPAIFTMQKGANPISMVKIVNGEFCGRCHGRVAFPLSNCNRCHVKPKG